MIGHYNSGLNIGSFAKQEPAEEQKEKCVVTWIVVHVGKSWLDRVVGMPERQSNPNLPPNEN